MNVSEVCARARDLILRDGFQRGGDGWVGAGGWCIEGALGRAMGLDWQDTHLSRKVNMSPVGQAILTHLHLPHGWSLHVWNDRQASPEEALRVLAEVAARWADGPPKMETATFDSVVLASLAGPIAVLPTVVLPPMPENCKEHNGWFKALVGV